MTGKRSSIPLTDYMYSKASINKVPISGTFELSPVCNFSCRMCYVRKTAAEVEQSSRSIMTLQEWLDIAAEARDAGMLYLLLTGGEPFLWPDFWELYEELIRMGFLISINTNGSLINDAAVERLKRFPPRRISITLYGANDKTYESLCGVKGVFPKVDHAVTALQEAGVQLKLSCSLTPYNAEDLEELVWYSEEKKLVLQATSYMFPPIRRDASHIGDNDRFTAEKSAFYRLKGYRLQYGESQYRAFLKKIEEGYAPPLGLDEFCTDPKDGRIRCRAGKASFWITWDGWMTPCGLMNVPKKDVREEGFAEAWKLLVHQCDSLATSGLCAHCKNFELCHPCAAIAQAETGSTGGTPKYLCRTIQEIKRLAHEELKKQPADRGGK